MKSFKIHNTPKQKAQPKKEWVDDSRDPVAYTKRITNPKYDELNEVVIEDTLNGLAANPLFYKDVSGFKTTFDFAISHSDVKDGDLYEFGCWAGSSLKGLKQSSENIKYKNVHVFDSFEGLPKEEEGVYRVPAWIEGNFSSKKFFATENTKAIKQAIKATSGFDEVNFIEGFYENTLNKETFENNQFNPAIVVHIDVDIYKSTVEVLEFLFQYKIIRKGTVLVYDDFAGIAPFDSGLELYGEKRAHAELCNKYEAKWEDLNYRYENSPNPNDYRENVIKILDYKGCP